MVTLKGNKVFTNLPLRPSVWLPLLSSLLEFDTPLDVELSRELVGESMCPDIEGKSLAAFGTHF